MEIERTDFEDLLIIKGTSLLDNRGKFLKLFNFDFFKDKNLNTAFKEFYYSVSKKDVIRGMHFQLPPLQHSKLVYVSHGKILDVVIDLRKSSLTYNKYFSIELNDANGDYLYIPEGFAHGFISLENDTIVNYAQTSCYSKEHDSGILYNSFGFEWSIQNPIISNRDLSFEKITNFESPFL